MRQKALAKSSVKIKANDVVASWKTLIGFGLFPIYYGSAMLAFYIFVSGLYAEGFIKRVCVTWVVAFIFFWYLAATIKLSDSLIYHARICTMRVFYVFYKKKVQLL